MTSPSPSFDVSGPSSAAVDTPVLRWLAKFYRPLSSLQVSHQGYKYSIERLLALDEYTRATPLWRAVLVCVGTPLPMIMFVLSQEMIPLEKPESGWSANSGFWVRTAILGGVVGQATIVQMKYLVGGITMSLWQMCRMSLCSALGIVATAVLIAATFVFPIPFMICFTTGSTFLVLAISFRVITGQQAFDIIRARPTECMRIIKYCTAQMSMCFVYPAYQVLFNAVTGTHFEFLAILFLPVLKMTLQNIIARTMTHMEDMIPESVIFTADFFNATYIATFMQSSSSTTTLLLIVTVDLVQTLLTMAMLRRCTSRILARLQQATDTTCSAKLLDVICLLIRNSQSLGKQSRGSFRRQSCIPHRLPTAYSNLMTSLNLSPEKAPVKPRSKHAPNTIVPTDIETSAPEVVRAVQRQGTLCPPCSHLKIVEKTLEALFTSEFVILTEYLEAFIPMVSGFFVMIMVHLPNAQYHIELDGITQANVYATVQNVFLYAMLEIVSLLVLVVGMKRSCSMDVLRHLSFVLETQMPLIQSKMLVWMLLTMSFRVIHFGTFCFYVALAVYYTTTVVVSVMVI